MADPPSLTLSPAKITSRNRPEVDRVFLLLFFFHPRDTALPALNTHALCCTAYFPNYSSTTAVLIENYFARLGTIPSAPTVEIFASARLPELSVGRCSAWKQRGQQWN